jgi:hypothetical protein
MRDGPALPGRAVFRQPPHLVVEIVSPDESRATCWRRLPIRIDAGCRKLTAMDFGELYAKLFEPSE